MFPVIHLHIRLTMNAKAARRRRSRRSRRRRERQREITGPKRAPCILQSVLLESCWPQHSQSKCHRSKPKSGRNSLKVNHLNVSRKHEEWRVSSGMRDSHRRWDQNDKIPRDAGRRFWERERERKREARPLHGRLVKVVLSKGIEMIGEQWRDAKKEKWMGRAGRRTEEEAGPWWAACTYDSQDGPGTLEDNLPSNVK